MEFFTDSQYVRQGISNWVAKWKKRGWRTVNKEPVKNDDLWQALDQARAVHQISWNWLKGHAGHVDNERCDQLAQEAIAQIRKKHSPQELRTELQEFKQRAGAAKAMAGERAAGDRVVPPDVLLFPGVPGER